MVMSLLDPISPSAADVKVAKESSRRLSKVAGRSLSISPQNGAGLTAATETIEIPAGAVPIIQKVLACMAQGLAVSLVPVHAQLTTQEAANLLGVSRPFVIKLLNQRALPHTKVGRHRRIVLQDVLDYKHRVHAERQKVLDELAGEGQRLGVGY